MKHLVNLVIVVLVSSVVFLVSSCSCNSKKGQENSSIVSDLKKDEVKKEITDFVYPLPTAFEVTKMLNRIGASYIFSISNPPENVEKCFTEKSKALNLGIYSADLSYASTYNQKQITIDYMNASNRLIDELGFADAIDKTLPEKIEQVEDDKEELIELITNTFYTTYESLNEGGRGSISVLVLAGSWVEALYIATHISEDTYNNVEMVKIVMDQKEPLNKLFNLIEENSSNKDIAAVGVSLQKLHTIFAGLEEGSISQAQMEAITTEVARVRSEMIE
jgi:hypothetical protein